MTLKIALQLFLVFGFHTSASAAILHFFQNPQFPQSYVHVSLEYQGLIYEADPRHGGHAVPIEAYKKKADVKIFLPDSFIDFEALKSQLGLKFDFEFIWNSKGTYCSKLVGLALGIKPVPMTFAGTHYLQYYPEWIHRNDPGVSPERVNSYGILHGTLLHP